MSIMSYSSCSSAGVVASSASLRHEQLYREGRHNLFSSEPLALIEQDMKLIKEQLFSNATASNNHDTGTPDTEEQRLLLRKRLIHLEHERKRVLKNQERYLRRRSQRHLVAQTTAQDEQENDENQHCKSSSDKVTHQQTTVSSCRRASMRQMNTSSLADVEEKVTKENQTLNEMISNALNDAMAAYLRKKRTVTGLSFAPERATPTHDIQSSSSNGKNAAFQSAKTSVKGSTTRSIYGAPPRPKKIQLAKAA